MGATGGDRKMTRRQSSASITLGPGLRAVIELVYGPEFGSKPLIRGRGQYSAREEVRAATDQLIQRQARDLKAATGPKPRCGYSHGAQLDCRDPDCQRWLDGVADWHQKQVGGPHADLTVWAAVWMAKGGALGLSTTDGEWRRNPVVLGEGPTVDGAWTTFGIHIHESASRSDVHGLVDKLWTEAHTRAGRLSQPARAVYWRHLSAKGWSHQRIADEWSDLTGMWAGDPDARPMRAAIEYAAYEEWQGAVDRRGRRKRVRSRADGDQDLIDASTVGWTLTRLAKLEADSPIT